MLKGIKEKYKNMNKNMKVFTIAVVAIVILSILLIAINRKIDYSEIKIKENKKTIFSIEDLKVDNIEFSATEKEIKKELGKPEKEKEEIKNEYKYKKLYYKGLTLLLRENYDDYMLVGATVTKSKYKLSRNIKVNDSIKKVMTKYKVDNEEGSYIYGNYSVNALNDQEVTENIYIGTRDKKNVVYINRDTIIKGNNTNIAKIIYTYKNGKVSKIKWIYDFQ